MENKLRNVHVRSREEHVVPNNEKNSDAMSMSCVAKWIAGTAKQIAALAK